MSTTMTVQEAGRALADPTAYADEARLHEALALLRREEPVHWVEAPGYNPFWAITKHEDVLEIERNNNLFLSYPRPMLLTAELDEMQRQQREQGMELRTLVHMDDPEHKKMRAITADWFKPRSLRRLEGRIRELAKRYVDRMAELGGECDFVTDVASQFPLYVILSVLGLPESDYGRMLKLTQELFGGDDPELQRGANAEDTMAALMDFFEYFKELTASRRANPTDDLASLIANAEVDGEPLSDVHTFSYYTIVASAGHDTTSSAIAGGLHALIEASGLAGSNIGELDVGFRLGPRLNASGRMGHARDAVELFTTADGPRAREIAEHLTRQNEARRAVEQEILQQAIEMAERSGMTGPDRRAIVLAHPDWHVGVVGIVCSRLVERYSRPVILMHRHGGVCSGSGRSVPDFNLHAALAACSHLLEKFGGHDMAAGVHVRDERLDEFVEAFIAQANAALAPDDLLPRVEIDCPAAIEELTPDAVSQLERLAPFGRSNPPVRVLLPSLRVAAAPRLMGAHGKHLELQVRSHKQGFGLLRLVGWGWGERMEALDTNVPLDAVIEPKLSRWNGRVRVEAELKDAAPAAK